jgi:hypothetical protein
MSMFAVYKVLVTYVFACYSLINLINDPLANAFARDFGYSKEM